MERELHKLLNACMVTNLCPLNNERVACVWPWATTSKFENTTMNTTIKGKQATHMRKTILFAPAHVSHFPSSWGVMISLQVPHDALPVRPGAHVPSLPGLRLAPQDIGTHLPR